MPAVSVTMGTNGQIAGFGAFVGGQPRASMSVSAGTGILNLANSTGATVVNLQAVTGGSGRLELGDASGQSMVEAGTTVGGVGLVRAYPTGLIGNPGTFLLGKR